MGPAVAMEEGEQEILREVLRMGPPRTFRLKPKDFEEHGYTRDCPGCKALLRGTAAQKHSVSCRTRMEEQLHDDDRVKRARARKEDFIGQALEMEECSRELAARAERKREAAAEGAPRPRHPRQAKRRKP